MERLGQIKVICPTRSRPKECKRMVDSFLENSCMSTIKLYLDNDDPCLDEYRDTIKNVSYEIDFRKPTTEIINSHWNNSAEIYKYFSTTNDDFIYRTKNWDLKLVSEIKLKGGIGIAYGNDLLQGVNMPTTSVISREIVEALGWLQMPRLTHLFGDNVWHVIGKACNCISYRQDVIIEHIHAFSNKVGKDETFNRTNSQEMYRKDEQAFIQWLKEESKEDIEKVKEAITNRMVLHSHII